MIDRQIKQDRQTEALITGIAQRAGNLYLTRQMLCTEAVLTALNQGLKGGLTEVQATAMSAPFCIALGESGCLCGALSGAVMASGLLLGKNGAYRHRKTMRDSARRLHDQFSLTFGATCCRVLSSKVKHDKKAHFQQCAELTARAAEMAARLVLEKRPDLARVADNAFVNRRQSTIGGMLSRFVQFIGPWRR